MAERKKLAIIDGKSVFYRGYYAMPNLSTKDGVPTGGVFGFATMALELLKRLKPDYVAVAWDKPKTNIRKRVQMYPEYKAGRKPAPPDFYTQIPILHDLLDAFGWPLYELDDYEADDIMGTLAVKAEKVGLETLLITSDLDMLQLVNHGVKVYALKRGFSNIEEFHPESFEAKYGILAAQFLDLKSLKGDSSDNIPGVPGIGEKTAIELLKTYKTLDDIYKNLDEIKESTRKKLEAGKESAYLSKKIGAIWCDAPLNLDLPAMDGTKIDAKHLRRLLEELEFRSLLRNLPENMQETNSSGQILSSSLKLPKHQVITSAKDLENLKFDKTEPIFIHSRSAGPHGSEPRVVIAGGKDTAYTLDLAKLDKKAATQTLERHLSRHSKGLVGYDVKNDLKVLKNLGIDFSGLQSQNLDAAQGEGEDRKGAVQRSTATVARSLQRSDGPKASSGVASSAGKQAEVGLRVEHDVLVGAFLINPLGRAQSLTDLARAALNYDGASFDDIPTEDLIPRGGEFISVIRQLYVIQCSELDELPTVDQLAKKVEWPLTAVLADMEMTGIKLNTNYLKKFAVQLEDSISDLEQKIYGHADQEFNISSPSQLADVLFTKLNLPKVGIKKGKTGFSTAASELDKLRGIHPVIDLITQYREATKLKNTYVDTLPKLVDEQSRVHTTFNLTVAQTGRLSSADPNLQNIPIRTELGRNIRTAFVADEGMVLVSADYSQFELRIAAALSGEKTMVDAFNRDADIHTETAAAVFGVPVEKVTKDQRYAAKAVNFGIMYGQGPHGLSAGTGMPYGEAKEFIDKYFEIRPKLKEYIDKLRKQATEAGYVETLLGRRRPTPDVHSSNFMVREAAYRAAINMPLQGTAADLMKLAMIKIQQNFNQQKAKSKKQKAAPQILLQIHDSILVECPEKEAEEVGKMLKDTMEGVYKLPVKLKADISTGKNWGEL